MMMMKKKKKKEDFKKEAKGCLRPIPGDVRSNFGSTSIPSGLNIGHHDVYVGLI